MEQGNQKQQQEQRIQLRKFPFQTILYESQIQNFKKGRNNGLLLGSRNIINSLNCQSYKGQWKQQSNRAKFQDIQIQFVQKKCSRYLEKLNQQ
ncbi:unnamed protein product [Paramecium pentaurelia]|uniref:Uncharacterized protein n=1 Tax=Paramecium pentaurelia TaxID=43138 RepID=A0A8S1YPX4_9CILI|nr:unnamed protein product [Paramecium pentaurelia]